MNTLACSFRIFRNFCRSYSKMACEPKHLVFVYGTLKMGEPNHYLISDSKDVKITFLSRVKTVKKWPLVIASRYNIPYLLYCEGKGECVIGELYEVDDLMLQQFDEFECHPTYYERMVEEVETVGENQSGKEIFKPWIYFLKNFRSEMLNLPFLSNYSSKGAHGLEYVTRYNRHSGLNYYSDVMNVA